MNRSFDRRRVTEWPFLLIDFHQKTHDRNFIELGRVHSLLRQKVGYILDYAVVAPPGTLGARCPRQSINKIPDIYTAGCNVKP